MNRSEQERYDAALEDPFAVECPVCSGHADAKPCSEECAELVERCRRERQIDACRKAAKLVAKMAKAYRAEGFPNDVRVTVCIDRIRYYRGQIRKLRAA
jgi:predicted nucleic acid-binding Zn ribbon protein